MTSAIDVTKPVYGNPDTQSVRQNFIAAHDEIGALQNAVATKVNKAGDTMLGFLTLYLDPELPMQAATKKYVDSKTSGTTTINSNADFFRWYSGPTQVAHMNGTGNLALAGSIGINGNQPPIKPTVNGSCENNQALKSLLMALESYGLIVDNTT